MTVARLGLALRSNEEGIADLGMTADGNLELVADGEAVGQHARQRIMTFEGEWFIDTTCGVPWLEQIMGRQFDEALAESVIKTEILETDGVTGIEAFAMSFDRRTRGIHVARAVVATEHDEVAQV
ncbi:hypothetical protein [Antarcticirhabdus aurantiaca]|uniref:Uncharacterized protein n=1 Tax=Antarcticirhabdus aurantiaca TaxID=2606717 RepID=A0ACD4NK58_9HYPH|nr:hypothetical protein [Antarcticirhabdus aurantiaca]WAJ27146.1 hypothetical protein OXU80_20150 [Jeongeuplla avenae]